MEYENYYLKINNSFPNPNWKSEPAEEWGIVGGLAYQRGMEVELGSIPIQRKDVPKYAKEQEKDYDSVVQVCFIPKSSEKEAWKTLDDRFNDEEIAMENARKWLNKSLDEKRSCQEIGMHSLDFYDNW